MNNYIEELKRTMWKAEIHKLNFISSTEVTLLPFLNETLLSVISSHSLWFPARLKKKKVRVSGGEGWCS